MPAQIFQGGPVVAKLSPGAVRELSRRQCSGAVFRRGKTPRSPRQDAETFPITVEIGNVVIRPWRPWSSPQTPARASVTDICRLIAASLLPDLVPTRKGGRS